MRRPTFGSLFAGIGGIDLGLECAGWQCIWQVENDPYAQKVLAKHWPQVRRWDEVRTFPPEGEWGCDLICGGFPCQPVSTAGKRLGRNDPRWLWPEFARVLRVLRPRFALIENTPGLFVRGFDDVLRDLAALGFDAEWETVPAAAFGAPHVRERLFVLAHAPGERAGPVPAGWRPEGQREGDADGRPQGLDADAHGQRRQPRMREPKAAGQPEFADMAADLGGAGLPLSQQARRCQSKETQDIIRGPVAQRDWWAAEPDVVRMVHGVPKRVDRIRGLGNAVVPQVAEWIGRLLIEASVHASD